MDKYEIVKSLEPGDKIQLTNGEVMHFVRMKQVKFVAKKDGCNYSIPYTLFDKLLQKDDLHFSDPEEEIQPGDLFFAEIKGDLCLYELLSFKQQTLVCKAPSTGKQYRITKASYFSRYEDVHEKISGVVKN